MNRVLSALVNGAALSLALTAAVWLLLRIVPRRLLNAATRYAVWWAALAVVLALPLIDLPLPRLHPRPAAMVRDRARPVAIAIPAVPAVRMVSRLPVAPDVPHRGPIFPIRLPAALLDSVDDADLDHIILHEAAHLARYDDVALLCERIVEALLWLHPAVRWIARQIDLEREIACDDRVIAATGQARSYASCLTRVVESGSTWFRPSTISASWAISSRMSRLPMTAASIRCAARKPDTRTS